MANPFDGTDRDREVLEAPLLDIDSELNIFALANGLDLFRNTSDAPDRTLEWYRDGMERRILVRAEGPDRYAVTASAVRRRDGTPVEARRPVRPELTAEELKSGLRQILAEGVEVANALVKDDLGEQG